MAYWAYRALERLAGVLPEKRGRRLYGALGRLGYRTLSRMRAVVAANQAQVLGLPVDDPRVVLATKEAFELYARFWFDAFLIRHLAPAEVNERTRFPGWENIDRAVEQGHGCICVIPHMGNWDLAGHVLAINGYKIAAVVEELKPPRLFDLFLRHREELGLKVIPLTKNGHVGQQLKQLLADNWVIALVADRDLSGRGIEVEMFGATRKVPAGPALLSITSGAPILMCSSNTLEDGWEVRIGPPLEVHRTGDLRTDIAALSREMARSFERAIAARPPDWHLFEPGWPDAAAQHAGRAREHESHPA